MMWSPLNIHIANLVNAYYNNAVSKIFHLASTVYSTQGDVLSVHCGVQARCKQGVTRKHMHWIPQ